MTGVESVSMPPIAEMSIVIGVLTLVIVCGGSWLYFRLRLHNPYLGKDPRAGRRRMIYEAIRSGHGVMFRVGIAGDDYSADGDIDDGGGGE